MKFNAPSYLGPYLRDWQRQKEAFEKETGKSKPGGWFSNKSGVSEALKGVDAAVGDLGITVRIVEKQVTAEAVKQLDTKVVALEKAERTLRDKATKYCQVAIKDALSGANAGGGSKEAARYGNSVKELVKFLGSLAIHVTKVAAAYRDFADAARKEALKAAKEGQQDIDASAKERFSKALDIFDLRLQKQAKAAKDLERTPDEDGYYGLAGPVAKAIEGLRDDLNPVAVSFKSAAVKAIVARLGAFETETGKFKGVKKGQKAEADKGLLSAIKQVKSLAADTPKLVENLRKEIRAA